MAKDDYIGRVKWKVTKIPLSYYAIRDIVSLGVFALDCGLFTKFQLLNKRYYETLVEFLKYYTGNPSLYNETLMLYLISENIDKKVLVDAYFWEARHLAMVGQEEEKEWKPYSILPTEEFVETVIAEKYIMKSVRPKKIRFYKEFFNNPLAIENVGGMFGLVPIFISDNENIILTSLIIRYNQGLVDVNELESKFNNIMNNYYIQTNKQKIMDMSTIYLSREHKIVAEFILPIYYNNQETYMVIQVTDSDKFDYFIGTPHIVAGYTKKVYYPNTKVGPTFVDEYNNITDIEGNREYMNSKYKFLIDLSNYIINFIKYGMSNEILKRAEPETRDVDKIINLFLKEELEAGKTLEDIKNEYKSFAMLERTAIKRIMERMSELRIAYKFNIFGIDDINRAFYTWLSTLFSEIIPNTIKIVDGKNVGVEYNRNYAPSNVIDIIVRMYIDYSPDMIMAILYDFYYPKTPLSKYYLKKGLIYLTSVGLIDPNSIVRHAQTIFDTISVGRYIANYHNARRYDISLMELKKMLKHNLEHYIRTTIHEFIVSAEAVDTIFNNIITNVQFFSEERFKRIEDLTLSLYHLFKNIIRYIDSDVAYSWSEIKGVDELNLDRILEDIQLATVQEDLSRYYRGIVWQI